MRKKWTWRHYCLIIIMTVAAIVMISDSKDPIAFVIAKVVAFGVGWVGHALYKNWKAKDKVKMEDFDLSEVI